MTAEVQEAMDRLRREDNYFAGLSATHLRYAAVLLIVKETVTPEILEEAFEALPEEIRAALAEGPKRYRYDCGVCMAFGKEWYESGECENLSDPRGIVFCWHEVPKLEMRKKDDQFYGEASREVFARCERLYRRAGWAG